MSSNRSWRDAAKADWSCKTSATPCSNALVDGDRVALELTWTAELKVPLGKLAVGDTMTAQCGIFFRIADGRISAQHSFDCFEAF